MKNLFYFTQMERMVFGVILVIVVAWCVISSLNKASAEAPPAIVQNIMQPDTASPNPKPKATLPAQRAITEKNGSKKEAQRTKLFAKSSKLNKGEKIELNRADTTDLKKVPGIGSTFARRILKYRDLLGGYYSVEQLGEVYGIDAEKHEALRNWFTVDTTMITPININEADYRSLLRHPYLSKEQTAAINTLRKRDKRIENWNNLELLEEISHDDKQRLIPYICFD